jgi:SAM-dependent methyltransferase
MISARLLDLVQCPDCGGAIVARDAGFACAACGRPVDGSRGYLDLRPRAAFAEQTKYLDAALHADARHEAVPPPLLGARIRNDMLRRFLALREGDRAIDLGCGSGRALLWNAASGAELTGIDVSPFFAAEAVARAQILRGDLRRLPLRTGVFNKAWSLDVLEHLSPDALRDVLGEANRVLANGGALFVYTHVRQNGWIAGGVRLVNRLAHGLERLGLLDLRQERLRKSDHLNPIADHADLARVTSAAGFRVERITYYTPILGAFVENILVRIGERLLTRRAARRAGGTADAEADVSARRAARVAAQARLGRRGPAYVALLALTAVMRLDVWCFGRLRSGPFFALLRKVPVPASEESRS